MPFPECEIIRDRLALIPEEQAVEDGLSLTAVALLLSLEGEELSVFFIERASDDTDPWSGNIGFPGGRMDAADRDLQSTAERETLEEVGINLEEAHYLGRLSDILGAHLPVRVACFVYFLEPFTQPKLNPEVSDAFRVPLSVLSDPSRRLTAQVSFGNDLLEAPAIMLPQLRKPVLWGITYRLLNQFMELIDARGSQK